ncbi:MAG TPA: hypothetical protein VFP25_07510 [Nitrososphaeraceae archaeon]|nr:hypothetical protein [Nitrososphaeraceae archaeon]
MHKQYTTKYLYNNKSQLKLVDKLTIRRILVAVDGSKPSLNASSQALDIA